MSVVCHCAFLTFLSIVPQSHMVFLCITAARSGRQCIPYIGSKHYDGGGSGTARQPL